MKDLNLFEFDVLLLNNRPPLIVNLDNHILIREIVSMYFQGAFLQCLHPCAVIRRSRERSL
jgi:hypothetical protein